MKLKTIFKGKTNEVRGVVARIGPWFGPSDVSGIVILLEGDSQIYRVLRDDNSCGYPAGLSKIGDSVTMQADESGSVSLSSFRNESLDRLTL